MELMTATEAYKKSQENCKNIVTEAIQDAIRRGKTSCNVSDITEDVTNQLEDLGYKVKLSTWFSYMIEWNKREEINNDSVNQ